MSNEKKMPRMFYNGLVQFQHMSIILNLQNQIQDLINFPTFRVYLVVILKSAYNIFKT